MLENQVEVKNNKNLMTTCDCPNCQIGVREDVCDCPKCRQNQNKPSNTTKDDNCHWKNTDQIRENRYPSSQAGKFIWEIECECAGCRGE